jgi:hypothetical protein
MGRITHITRLDARYNLGVRRFRISPAPFFIIAGFLAFLSFVRMAATFDRRGADYAPLVLGMLIAWLGICRVRYLKRKSTMWPKRIKFRESPTNPDRLCDSYSCS